MLTNLVTIFNNSFPLTISLYIVLMLAIVGITTLLERFCVTLKIKKNLSDGLVGGIILGAITSLPEFITCLTSVIETKKGQMGIGDIVGSNMFDLFVLGVCLFICIRMFINRKANDINIKTLICTGVGTIFVFLAALLGEGTQMGIYQGLSPFVWHGFNFFSIPIFISYGFSVFFILRNNRKHLHSKIKPEGFSEKAMSKSRFMKLSTLWLLILILITALILIVVGVVLTCNASSLIRYHWGLNEGFGGSLLLGVCTSLPEIVACINLCIHREYNMTIDTMVGSTSFNLSVLSISNIALACVYTLKPTYLHGPIMYEFDIDSITQMVICMFTILASLAYLIFNTKKNKERFNNKNQYILNGCSLTLMIVPFIIFIILGFVYNAML